MVGLLVVTHGQLGRELVSAVEMIQGPQERMYGVAVEQKDDMPTAAKIVERAFEIADGGDGVIIFTDLLGGTPSNISLTFLNRPKVEVISGVNLPMLLKAAGLRATKPFEDILVMAHKGGVEGITVAGLLLEKDSKREPASGKG